MAVVGELITRAQQLAGRVDSKLDDRTLEFIKEAQDHWCTKRPWSSLRRTFDLTCDGSRFLYMPADIQDVRWIVDKSNGRALLPRQHFEQEYTEQYVEGSTGAAHWWRLESWQPVFHQPALPGYFSVRSEASEGGSVFLSGYVQDTEASGTAGEFQRFDEVLAFIETTSATSAYQYTDICCFERLVHGSYRAWLFDPTGRKIATINPGRTRSRYARIELHPAPQNGTVLRCNGQSVPQRPHDQNSAVHSGVNPNFIAWYAASLIHKAMGEGDMARQCMGQAEAILNNEADREANSGGEDFSAIPDPIYWSQEKYQAWPLP